MTVETRSPESAVPMLILFTTGNAPRSRRARKNLAAALESQGMDSVEPMEIDLLERPEQSVSYSVFATPALLRTDQSGGIRVLYGDLSDEHKLLDFLEELRSG
ncbi:MAG: circadian clock KaiB family protein [Candidatus Wenzhouxiangella sp. M2_3B_020]